MTQPGPHILIPSDRRHPWWQSERRIRARHSAAGVPHRPDAEVHWPSVAGSTHAGQVWAVEVELTPKPVSRTTAIMTELTAAGTYSRVIYFAAPAARAVLARAAQRMATPPGMVAIWDLPPAAYPPDPTVMT